MPRALGSVRRAVGVRPYVVMTSNQNDHKAELIEPLMTVPEVCAYLRVTKYRLYNWKYKNKGPKFLMVETSLRYRRSDIDAWLEGKDVA